MRKTYVHESVVSLAIGSDERGPGAAVTVELCGQWEHEGGCRWPHRTSVVEMRREATVRTVFVAEEHEENLVRAAISRAIRNGEVDGGRHSTSTWTAWDDHPSAPTPDEEALGARLAG